MTFESFIDGERWLNGTRDAAGDVEIRARRTLPSVPPASRAGTRPQKSDAGARGAKSRAEGDPRPARCTCVKFLAVAPMAAAAGK